MTRRNFIGPLLASGLAACLRGAVGSPRPKILIRSSWQTVNIGDIGHTPGLIRLLEEFIPEAELRLWPSDVGRGVEAMLRRRFPRLVILKGEAAVADAIRECDFLLHGSGPYLVAEPDVARWQRETGKPFGVFGITLLDAAPYLPERVVATRATVELLSAARFVYFRDSVSLALARRLGCTCPVMEFGPDAAFGADVRDDEAADRFLRAHGLEDGKFLCVIGRFRNVPAWLMYPNRPRDPVKHARNEAKKERDHWPLREAISAVVRETPMKILLCPEDTSQMAINREMLYDPLPADVKRRVVWREDYWLTDEAVSTYVRSAGLFGHEMHSPIMCIGNAVPAIVCRWEEQTSKGIMWRDIGLADWLFDFDRDDDKPRLVEAVRALAHDLAAARAKAARARETVRKLHRAALTLLAKTWSGG